MRPDTRAPGGGGPPASTAQPPPGAAAGRASGRVLRRNFGWMLASALIYALAQWGVLVAYAKLGGPALLGEFALGLAVTAPVMLFARMELRPLQATDARSAFGFEHYFGLMVLNAVGGVLVSCLVGLVAGYSARVVALIALLAVAKGLENVSEVYYGALEKHERMPIMARSIITKSVLSVSLVSLTLWLTRSTLLAAAALVLSWGLVLVLRDVHAYRREFGDVHPWQRLRRTGLAPVKGLLHLAYALGFVALLSSLRPNVPRYIIEAHYGEAQLGMYAALAYFTALGGRVIQSLGIAVTPRLGRYHAAGDHHRYGRAILGLAGAASLVGACGILGALLLGRPVLTLVYGPEYAQDLRLFVWLMVAAAAEYICVGFKLALFASRQIKVQVLMFSASVATVAVASAWWVPRVGPVGAAWALALGWLVELASSTLLSLRAWRRLAAGGPVAAVAPAPAAPAPGPLPLSPGRREHA